MVSRSPGAKLIGDICNRKTHEGSLNEGLVSNRVLLELVRRIRIACELPANIKDL